MLVVAVGEHSQKGKISALLDSPNEDTPLTKKLEHLANRKPPYPPPSFHPFISPSNHSLR